MTSWPEAQPEMFWQLRALALHTKLETLKIANIIDPRAAYGAVMDLNIGGQYATIVGFATGDASVYLSSGGGFIGGVGHESVANAARAFVQIASHFSPRMRLVADFPLPRVGETTFYVLTKDGVVFAEDAEANIVSGKSVYTPLFGAGQNIITAYRLLPHK